MKDFLGWVDNEDMVVLAAEDADGELAGYAVAVCEQSPPLFSTGRTGKVWDLCVLQDHRGCGLGVELMEAVFNELQKRGAEDVTLHVALANPAAIRLYEKLGMRAVMYRMHKKL